MYKQSKDSRATLKRIGVIASAVVAVFIILFAIKVQSFYKTIYKTGTKNATPVPAEKKIFTFVLMGYGGGTHDGTYLTDSIMVLHLDTEKDKATLFSIPRDLWVKVPTKSGTNFHIKINALYQMNLFPQDFPDVDTTSAKDAKLIKNVIGEITGLPIDYYGTVDFAGFKEAIDTLGGIDVTVAKTFDDYSYPIDGKEKDLCGKDEQLHQIEPYLGGGLSAEQEEAKKKLFEEKPELNDLYNQINEESSEAFPCRYEHLHFEAGKVHMDGATALKYVRSRHALQDGGDFGRAARQQRFIEAVKNKIISLGFISKIFPLLDKVGAHISTDLDPATLQRFIGEGASLSSYRIANYVLSTDNVLENAHSADGQYILTSQDGEDNWTSVRTVVKNVIAGITPTPTPGPTKIPTLPSAKKLSPPSLEP